MHAWIRWPHRERAERSALGACAFVDCVGRSTRKGLGPAELCRWTAGPNADYAIHISVDVGQQVTREVARESVRAAKDAIDAAAASDPRFADLLGSTSAAGKSFTITPWARCYWLWWTTTATSPGSQARALTDYR